MNNKLLKSLLIVGSLAFTVNASYIPHPTYADAVTLSDIDGSYAKNAILELANAGILNGYEGKFDPQGNIQRQDFAIILAKALKLDVTNAPATPTFSDVPTTHYSFAYVEAAVKAGLLKGTGNDQFSLGEDLTRESLAVLFIRALGVDATGKGSNLEFKDAGSISAWAKDAVGAAVEFSLINGFPNGTFSPQQNATREQSAFITSKFLKVKDDLDSKPTPAPVDPTPVPELPKPEPGLPKPVPIDPTPTPDYPTPVPVDPNPGDPIPVQEPNIGGSNQNPNTPNPVTPIEPQPEL